jgi:hypothetical protein
MRTALRLYDAAAVHASLVASATFGDFVVWTTGPCVFGDGSLLATLDGGPVAKGPLPVGSHTLVVAFSNCLVDGLGGSTLHGTASATYTTVDLSDVTASVSASSMRGTELPVASDLYDVTADGSGTWRRVTTSTGSTTTFTATGGSRLIDNVTTTTATFAGGS